MKLLVVTQVVDTTDTYLSFFHTWIEQLAQNVESVEVVCLYEGKHALPNNVRVHSLGKEKGRRSGLTYALRFLSTIWKLQKEYDTVLVHMNEEYVLVGGLFWKLLGKPVYMWRNHYAGSLSTGLAAGLSRKVFYTSEHSYTARFKNAVRMPVGVDLSLFETAYQRVPRSILFLGRFSVSKHPDVLIEALGLLKKRGVAFTASVYGSALPNEQDYKIRTTKRARELDLTEVIFHEGIPHEETPRIFKQHEIFVNLGGSGMLDKTLLEAATSGCYVLARSEDWKDLTGGEGYISDITPEAVADAIERALTGTRPDLRTVVEGNSLRSLVSKLCQEMGVE